VPLRDAVKADVPLGVPEESILDEAVAGAKR
jgi:hypothetical protein